MDERSITDRRPFLALLIGAAVILWLAREVIGPFVVAAVLAYAFAPLVARAQERTGWSRIAIVAIAFAVVVVILGVLAVVLVGRIANEVTLLAASGPDSLATLLREVVGSDSVVIGGQTIAVADIARELQARLL